jgi:hypothetical protein
MDQLNLILGIFGILVLALGTGAEIVRGYMATKPLLALAAGFALGYVVARISGMSVADNGLITVADVSEGNIKIFRSSGRFVQAVGRAGAGPGEYGDPRFVDWGNDGRLHIIDRAVLGFI